MLSRQLCSGLGRAGLASQARCLHTPTHRASIMRGAQALAATSFPLVNQRSSVAATGAAMGHGGLFKIEKLFPLAMLPLFPAGYFIHGNPLIDYGLAFAISLHAHWGVHIVIEDYGRPIILGPGLAKIAHNASYLISVLLLAGLLSFNYNDVGITTGMQMIWSL